jgi:predicted DNA-binding protein (UPF0251 family)
VKIYRKYLHENFYYENILIIFAIGFIAKFQQMPRRKQPRKIVEPPRFKGFEPHGFHGENSNGEVELLYEEYEAIKLADYDGMSHHQACVLMGISRPTFARIYESARQKIARALVEVRSIRSVYGNVKLENDWFKCSQCHNLFTLTGRQSNKECPICKSTLIETIQSNKR